MAFRWQLREPYFQGANEYTLESSTGEKIILAADRDGYFDLNEPPAFALGVFARPVKTSA